MAETFATVGPLSRVRTSTRSKTPNAPEPTRKLFASTRRDGKVARYKRRELLGKGSFAEVWKADDRKAGHQVALKIMKENDDAAQFEYQITKDLDHMNIIKVLSSIQSPKQFIIVQELAEGGELFNKIVPDVGLDEYQARRTLSDMLDAIDYLSSKGIVHTDIKPENIVLGLDGRSKLCDFGLAEYSGQLIMRRHGTEPYMPPEVLKNPASHVFVHTSWDTWSLGVVLFVMMVGDFPWERAVPSDPEYKGHIQGGHVHRGWRHFSQALVEVLDSMLTNEPGQRCTTANVRPVLSVPWKRSSISRSSSLRRSSNKSLDMKVDTSSDITMCSYATTCTGVSQMSVPESVPDAEFGFDEEDF